MEKEKLQFIKKEILPYILIIIFVILLRTFIITPAIVDGSSMEPTLNDNNVILLNKFNYKVGKINRFDIVVLKHGKDKLIKRVIGLPGENIEYKNNSLYVNGFIVKENFSHKDTMDFKLSSIGSLNIPGDMYFVVGDNRGNSVDSRMIGLIDKKDILGNSSIRIFPFNKIGRIK